MIVRDKMFGNFEFCSTRTSYISLTQHFISSRRQTADLSQGQDAAPAEELPRGEVPEDEDDQRSVDGEPGVPVGRVGQQLWWEQLDEWAEQQERRWTGEWIAGLD